MQVTNKFGQDVTTYVLGLLKGYITKDEFELLTLTVR